MLRCTEEGASTRAWRTESLGHLPGTSYGSGARSESDSGPPHREATRNDREPLV